MAVNKERVQKLVDALRSGEYKQGSGQLRQEEYYCCLGVACDLFQAENPQSEWVQKGYGRGGFEFTAVIPEDDSPVSSTSSSQMPPVVAAWYGLPEGNPILIPTNAGADSFAQRAAHLNDGTGEEGEGRLDFSEIADLFEAEFIKEANEEGG